MTDHIWQAEFQQRVFRQLVEAFSRPGSIVPLPENPRSELAVLATLTDNETSLADPHALLDDRDWLRLQLTASQPEKAAYIIADGAWAVDFKPRLGTLASPEHGATLVIRVKDFTSGPVTYMLKGPGIAAPVTLAPLGLDDSWLRQRQQWTANFPLGVDCLLVADDAVLALPRTTLIEETH